VINVGVEYLTNDSIEGGFMFALILSACSNQYCSNSFSGRSSPLLPAIIEAFSPPIDVPATMSILILLFASALRTPHPKNLPLEVSEHSQWYRTYWNTLPLCNVISCSISLWMMNVN
jgi:hypothetical protein